METVDSKQTCYVFSQSTLMLAIDIWIEERVKKASEKEEAFLITKAALPWLMGHLNQRDLCMFTSEKLEKEIDTWRVLQLVSYPHQKSRIDETCELINDFFYSDVIKELKMMVN